MWSLQQLHSLLVTGYNDGEAVTHHLQELKAPESALGNLLQELPQALLRQYEYEDISVRSGLHLMHSDFFKVVINSVICVNDSCYFYYYFLGIGSTSM